MNSDDPRLAAVLTDLLRRMRECPHLVWFVQQTTFVCCECGLVSELQPVDAPAAIPDRSGLIS